MDKIKIEENTVMETLVLPLFGRAYCSKKYPGGGICFDAENQAGVDKSNKVLEKITTFDKVPENIRNAKFIPFFTRKFLAMGMSMGYIKFVEIRF